MTLEAAGRCRVLREGSGSLFLPACASCTQGVNTADEGFLPPSPPPGPHHSLPAVASTRVAADLRPGPPSRVLIPMRLRVTPSVVHHAPRLPEQLEGALSAASTLGSLCGNSGLLHPPEQAGRPPGLPAQRLPPRKEGFLGSPSARCFPSGCGGSGRPHTPPLGS